MAYENACQINLRGPVQAAQVFLFPESSKSLPWP